MGFLGKLLGKPMTREQFKETVRSRIIAKFPDIKIKADHEFGFECEVYGQSIDLFLDSAYSEYARHPKNLDAIIDHPLQAMLQKQINEFVPWDEAKHRIFPSLKPKAYFDAIRKMQEGDALVEGMIAFDWKNGIRIAMVLDFERSMRFVRKEELEQWGVEPEELREQALKNLASKTGPLWEPALNEARKSKIFRFAAFDGYDASRILLPDLYDRVSRVLESEKIVVIVPMRDLLMAFPYENEESNRKIKEETQRQFARGVQSVSPEIFVLTPDS